MAELRGGAACSKSSQRSTRFRISRRLIQREFRLTKPIDKFIQNVSNAIKQACAARVPFMIYRNVGLRILRDPEFHVIAKAAR